MGCTFSSSRRRSRLGPYPSSEPPPSYSASGPRPPRYSHFPPTARRVSRRNSLRPSDSLAASGIRDQLCVSKEMLLYSLRIVGEYLYQQGVNIIIVASADVVDMVHLDILPSSDNIAFFNYRLTGEQTNVLSDAVDEAILRQGLCDSNFLSDSQFPQRLGERLTEDSILQSHIIYHRGGLTVLAPPWNYLFCYQVYFLDTRHGIYETDDLDDAVDYLKEYLARDCIHTVPYSDIRRWAVQFCLHLPRRILAEVNDHYYVRFSRSPIDFST
ncbi:hypothetical protein EMPG_10702 [Blastomyces silverae]|uniref:Uncharacterized protein n=1 Tax=Blastomyces silverae TaxID=2060906 RepID=A0A0H1B4G3_9EURO|nr:hypothetical protein EMPG_10702 [Blastomyces silverae]